jgi:hypothetical protein
MANHRSQYDNAIVSPDSTDINKARSSPSGVDFLATERVVEALLVDLEDLRAGIYAPPFVL